MTDPQPGESLEQWLLQLWTVILPYPPAGPDDEFFDLGGQSLHLIHLVTHIQERFALELPLEELFAEEVTVRTVAALIRRLQAAEELQQRLAGLDPKLAARLLSVVEELG